MCSLSGCWEQNGGRDTDEESEWSPAAASIQPCWAGGDRDGGGDDGDHDDGDDGDGDDEDEDEEDDDDGGGNDDEDAVVVLSKVGEKVFS